MSYTRESDRFIDRFVTTHCHQRRVASLVTLIAVMLVTGSGPTVSGQIQHELSPYVVRATDQHGTAVGLIYPIEMLAALVARQPLGTVSSRITDAVRHQTPIVIMWRIPPNQDFGPAPRPYHIAIVERDEQAYGNPNRIEPVWIRQDAAELAQLDSRTRFEEVGAMAAFRLAAFVPGRRVVIYLHVSTDESGRALVRTRSGWIDWDPARDQKR